MNAQELVVSFQDPAKRSSRSQCIRAAARRPANSTSRAAAVVEAAGPAGFLDSYDRNWKPWGIRRR